MFYAKLYIAKTVLLGWVGLLIVMSQQYETKFPELWIHNTDFTESKGHIFSPVQPFYEWAVSDLAIYA